MVLDYQRTAQNGNSHVMHSSVRQNRLCNSLAACAMPLAQSDGRLSRGRSVRQTGASGVDAKRQTQKLKPLAERGNSRGLAVAIRTQSFRPDS